MFQKIYLSDRVPLCPKFGKFAQNDNDWFLTTLMIDVIQFQTFLPIFKRFTIENLRDLLEMF